MRKGASLAALLLPLVLLGATHAAEDAHADSDGHGPGDDGTSVEVVDPPRPAPPLGLEAAGSGEVHALADYRGRVVVINFWATWCAPCRREMPSLERAHREFADDGVSVLAVSMGDVPEDIEVFAESFDIELTMPLLMDRDRSVTEAWGVKHLPTTFVLNGEGEIVYRVVGELEWDSEETRSMLLAIGAPAGDG